MGEREDLKVVKKIARQYLKELNKNGINITKAYVYGSFARGENLEYSDIDLALISNNFSGNRFDDAIKIIPFRRKIDNRIEPMPYRPEDFTENDPLVTQIVRTGVKIK